MYIFYISKSEVKKFMNAILKSDSFDFFEVRSVEIETFVKFDIIGNLKESQNDMSAEENNGQNSENDENKKFFCEWGRIKPYAFELIKGKTKPKFMKIVISADSELCKKISPNAAALFLNFVFENDIVTCTTGSAQKNFSLNKDVENNWEEYVKKFFKHIGIFVSEEAEV